MWCPILDVVKNIAETYYKLKGDYGNYSIEEWMETLKEIAPTTKELKIMEPLQVNQYEDLVLIRFGLAEMQDKGGEMWSDENSIYRECRSVVIDIRTFEIVQAPFRKFFNFNEVEENLEENVVKEIASAKSVEFTNKLDGSMQCATMYKGEILLTGSMAISPKNSWRLEEGYKLLTDNHRKMIEALPSLTFIFEFISLKDPHVVVYTKEQEGLYLIGIRDKRNGRQLSYKEVKGVADFFKVPMTEIEKITLQEALEKAKSLKCCDKEGWVVSIDGHMIKLKCDDFVKIHRSLDIISSVNVIIESIAESTYDDLISKLPKGYRERAEIVAKKIFKYVAEKNTQIYSYYNEVKHISDEREAMKYITLNVPRECAEYVRNLYRGYDFNVLKTRSRYKKLKELGIVEHISNVFEEEI